MQRSVEIKSRELTLRGMLHIPEKADKKTPIVIIYHGFGGNKMGPHFAFVKLSRILEKHGIASARFDFIGSGESDGDFSDMTFANEIDDANAIFDYVKGLDFIDRDKIGVFGYSMGGAIASVIAGDRREEINTLCLLAPAGNMEEIVKEVFIGDKYNEYIREGCFDIQGFLLGKNFMDDIKNIDIFERASRYNKKSMIIHSTSDEVVTFNTSKIYMDIYKQNSELKVIEDANHTFENNKWEKKIINYVVDYFNKKLAD
ncbi:alpha/beta hydrolase [Clostridium sp. DMHC 10]|uniref:alpha/beta hydrolase n=1 Tax=Clostridium sp. DMHC 10 TaxID=747377 RepID=UPI00069E2A72|nr:alpha/beta hydrolase [Clostridium sp. DMHC 10]KOF57654.1 alpha/beta hydrolase [Clostridium sp. DMHC 10]